MPKRCLKGKSGQNVKKLRQLTNRKDNEVLMKLAD